MAKTGELPRPYSDTKINAYYTDPVSGTRQKEKGETHSMRGYLRTLLISTLGGPLGAALTQVAIRIIEQ